MKDKRIVTLRVLLALFLTLFILIPVSAGSSNAISTSTDSYAVYAPFQRKTFYANGRYWVFWFTGSSIAYSTSTDGASWATYSIRSASNGYDFSVWFDGTYLHYAYAHSSSLYYRRGLPNSDGTITWSAAEQTVSTSYNSASYPFVSTDTNGYPWIAYTDYYGGSYSGFVVKSKFNNGTWSTDSGFPYQPVGAWTANPFWCSIIPLTGGKMLWLGGYYNYRIYAAAWSGSAWGSTVNNGVDMKDRFYSAVAEGDYAHIVFLKATSYDIVYMKYDYSSNSFTGQTTLVSGASSSSAPVISIDSSNNLYVFAATKTTNAPSGWTANHVYFKKYSGSWGSWVDWLNEESDTLYSASEISCSYERLSGKIGFTLLTKTSSPFNVKFAIYGLPPNAPTLNNPAANARLNPSGAVSFTWTHNDPESEPQYAFRLQIGNSDFSTIYLDTDKWVSSIQGVDSYLPSNVGLYYWRVKTWDSENNEGAWSAGRPIIADRLIVSFKGVDDDRRDINTQGEIRFRLRSECDGTPVTTGSVYINGTLASWDSSNSWWKTTYTLNTVGKRNFIVTSATWGSVTALNPGVATNATSIIWDRLVVSYKSVDDDRRDVNTQGKVMFRLRSEYDNSPVQSGSVTVNGTSATWDSANGYWYIPYTSSTVGKKNFIVSTVNWGIYGITALNPGVASNSTSIIWDRLIVSFKGVDDDRRNVGSSGEVRFKLRSEYDGAFVASGTVAVNGSSATWDPAGSWWKLTGLSYAAPTIRNYVVTSANWDTYGVTALNPGVSTNSTSIIWDRVSITLIPGDYHFPIGRNMTIYFEGVYEYDGQAFNGSITFNSTLVKDYPGDYGLSVASITDPVYGLTAFQSEPATVTVDYYQANNGYYFTLPKPFNHSSYSYEEDDTIRITGLNMSGSQAPKVFIISLNGSVEATKFFEDYALTIIVSGPTDSTTWLTMSVPYSTHATAKINGAPATERSLTELIDPSVEAGWSLDRFTNTLYVKCKHHSSYTFEFFWAESELPSGERGGGGGGGGVPSGGTQPSGEIIPTAVSEELGKPEIMTGVIIIVAIFILVVGVRAKSKPEKWFRKKKRKNRFQED
jgi:hypothetical protein